MNTFDKQADTWHLYGASGVLLQTGNYLTFWSDLIIWLTTMAL